MLMRAKQKEKKKKNPSEKCQENGLLLCFVNEARAEGCGGKSEERPESGIQPWIGPKSQKRRREPLLTSSTASERKRRRGQKEEEHEELGSARGSTLIILVRLVVEAREGKKELTSSKLYAVASAGRDVGPCHAWSGPLRKSLVWGVRGSESI